MIKELVFAFAIMSFTTIASANEEPGENEIKTDSSNDISHEREETDRFYVGLNLLSPFSFIENGYTKIVFPLLSNLENGVSIHGGYFFKESHSVELRTSYGIGVIHSHFYQLHAGYNFYIYKRNLFVGLYSRFIQNYNDLTREHYFHISPYLNIGWRWTIKKIFYIDIRINWDFAAISWTTVNHARAGAGFMLVPPTLSINVGYNF